MICYLIEFVDPFDVRADYGLLLLEHPDISVNLDIRELLIVKAPQCCGHLVLTLVIEQHVVSVRVVVDFELSAHRLLQTPEQTAHDDHVIQRLTIEFTDIIRPRLGVVDHLERHWRENFVSLGGTTSSETT